MQALTDITWTKINETLREQWRWKSIRSLNFLTSYFILEENNYEMEMQRAYIWTSRMSNAQFSYSSFGFDFCGRSSQITPFYLKLYFTAAIFLYALPIFRKQLFLEHLCTIGSICSIEKDTMDTTRDSLKDCILACKISNQVQYKLWEKKSSHKHFVVILFKNDCSVRHMFCTIFLSLSVGKILRSSSNLP